MHADVRILVLKNRISTTRLDEYMHLQLQLVGYQKYFCWVNY